MLKRSLMWVPHCGFVNAEWISRTVPSYAVKFCQHFLAQVFRTIFSLEATFATLASLLLPTEVTSKIEEKGLLRASLPSPLRCHLPILTELKEVMYACSTILPLFSSSEVFHFEDDTSSHKEEGWERETRGTRKITQCDKKLSERVTKIYFRDTWSVLSPYLKTLSIFRTIQYNINKHYGVCQLH